MKIKIALAVAGIAFASTAAYAAEKCCCDKDNMAGMEKPAPAPAPHK